MIGVEGQYLFRFSLGNREDFIEESNLLEFTIVEEAGGGLPTFQIAFTTSDEDVLMLLNERNVLEVSMGKNEEGMIASSLSVISVETSGSGSDLITIYVAGMLNAIPYSNESVQFISQPKSAVEVMKEVTSKYFVPDFNITRSTGRQRWIQPNTSTKKFVNELWLHTNIMPSFPAIAVTMDGRFRLRDIFKLVGEDYDWRFINLVSEDNDIKFDDDYTLKSRSGFVNSWVGYGREKLVYNLDDSTSQSVLKHSNPIIAITKELARREGINKRFASVAAVNSNVHPSYWEAYQHNLVSLASMGNINLTASFLNNFKMIRVLDLVMFQDTNNDNVRRHHAGLYLVARVARTLSNRQFSTTVVLTRESFNEMKFS